MEIQEPGLPRDDDDPVRRLRVSWQGFTGTEIVGAALDVVRRAWQADPTRTTDVVLRVAKARPSHPVDELVARLRVEVLEERLEDDVVDGFVEVFDDATIIEPADLEDDNLPTDPSADSGDA